jgi:acyl-CoA synthetase (AMP-forming)/AMP-acid ligase II
VNLSLVLDMACSGHADRVAVTTGDRNLTYAEIDAASRAVAAELVRTGATALVHLGTNAVSLPVCLFGAARAGVPFVPLNYRLSQEQLAGLLADHPGALLVHEGAVPAAFQGQSRARDTLDDLPPADAVEVPEDDELVAVLLYTSGTTAAPKGALLRHRHLLAYVLGTVEFGGADEDEAALVTVPPYHIAGVTNLVSNLYAGRRIVYLDAFDPATWLETVRREQVTQAMVVPTMLARVVDLIGDAPDPRVGSLRTLSYGGARMPLPVLERALVLFPEAGFVNAYGLTETSSTIALLGPDEHRAAFSASDPAARARLASVGRLVPGIELEVRDEDGAVLPPGTPGLLFLRGEQVSGEYAGSSVLDADGWFPTRDRGWVDEDGYLFLEGRADDTIIRGGENIAPAEIEDVLLEHPGVVDAVVVGVPDDEWGQRLAAVVVAADGSEPDIEELRAWVRARLRSSKTPDLVEFRAELPRTDTGKLLRRQVLAELADRQQA